MKDNDKKNIEGWLKLLDFVRWDRFCLDKKECTVFGWIDREDFYKDFVVLYFVSGDVDSFMTSSSKYSLKLYKILNYGNEKGHVNCQRVESTFKLKNSIKLSS